MKNFKLSVKIKSSLVIALIIVSISFKSAPQHFQKESEVEQKASSESIELLESMIHELMNLPSTPPGLSVALGSNNEIIYSEGFGYSDLSKKEKVNPTTQFRAGSLSRIFTTTALSKLVESDILDFNTDLHAIMPEYPQKEYPISIKQLALGVSGMQHYSDEDRLIEKDYSSVKEALQVFEHIPLSQKPGEKYQFSVHSYTLLSRVLEIASSKSFIQLLADEVFTPLQLTSTAAESLLNPANELTKYYKFTDENLFEEIESPRNYSFSWGGSGLVSTPSDLVLLSQSLTNGYISNEMKTTIFENQKLNSGETMRESIGWDQNWDMADRKVYEQDGAGEGTRSIVSMFPDSDLSISIMTNSLRLWAIEETAHTLSIPFLTEAEPIKQPVGSFEITVFEDTRGQWVEKAGRLVLGKNNNELLINPGQENEESYKLIYLNRKNMYALIHQDGILYAEINKENEGVSGKVMYYRGPNIHKTSEEPPYLKFNS